MIDRQPTGWVFYDGQCSFCRASLRPLTPALRKAGLEAVALQEPGVGARLGLSGTKLMEEMRILTADGRLIGGADACVYLARLVPWAWPLYGLAQLPGAMSLLRRGYRWLARRRQCLTTSCPVTPNSTAKRDEP